MLQDPPPTIQLVIMQAVFFTYSDKLIRDLQFLRGHGRGGDKENKTESNLHSALDAKSESPTHAEYVFHLRAFQINILSSLPFCNDCSKFWRHQKTLFSSVKSQGNCTTHLKTKMGSGPTLIECKIFAPFTTPLVWPYNIKFKPKKTDKTKT